MEPKPMTVRTVVKALLVAGLIALSMLGVIALIYIGGIIWLMSIRG